MRLRSLIVLAASLLMLAAPLSAQGQTGPQPVEPVPGEPAAPTGGATVPITPPAGAPGQPATPTVVTPATPTVVTPAPTTTPAPAAAGTKQLSKAQDRGLAWLTIGLIALALLLLGVLIVLVLWRVRGWDPRWLRSSRHATAEAGWRVGLGGAELRDFVRLGR